MVTDNSSLDGRPACSISHWDQHFHIYYLTEKMRSQADPYFSEVCDRVKVGKLLDEDIEFLKLIVLPCHSELSNENFKSGRLSIIVTTNDKKEPP